MKIKDIKERASVSGAYLVTKKDTALSRAGKPYLVMRIADSTGEVEARVWDDADSLARGFDKNDVVLLKGTAVSYQGGLQVNIHEVSRAEGDAYAVTDYLPASKNDLDQMMAELDERMESIKDRHLKALLSRLLGKDGPIRDLFRTAPASKTMHHPYIGGLVEHVLSICGLVESVTAHYRGRGDMNKDLLMAGAILHDIGKVREFSWKGAFEYTDEGKLLGHITIGLGMVEEAISAIEGFPQDLAMLVKHMMLSHHGELEFGSPKRPKFLEAMVLYYLDDLDAKVACVSSLVENDRTETDWTGYHKLLERYIYKKTPAAAGAEGKDKDAKGELDLF